jgi:hypothetical protein
MSKPEIFWNIRFTALTRRMFSEIPRGEADRFAAVVARLRRGPNQPGVSRIGDNLFQFSDSGYRVAFEMVDDARNTVRITAFEREESSSQ